MQNCDADETLGELMATPPATLWDYRRLGNAMDFRAYPALSKRNAKKALCDGRVVWMSKWALSLWDDRRNIKHWKMFAESVEVLNIVSINNEWQLATEE
jgi:hypothetical protein